MTEKKTFKNVLMWSAHTDGARVEWLVSGEGVYSAAEWDMEVTFTKKPMRRKVGDVIKIADFDDSLVYTVLAIHKDQIVVVNQYDDIEIFGAGYFG